MVGDEGFFYVLSPILQQKNLFVGACAMKQSQYVNKNASQLQKVDQKALTQSYVAYQKTFFTFFKRSFRFFSLEMKWQEKVQRSMPVILCVANEPAKRGLIADRFSSFLNAKYYRSFAGTLSWYIQARISVGRERSHATLYIFAADQGGLLNRHSGSKGA